MNLYKSDSFQEISSFIFKNKIYVIYFLLYISNCCSTLDWSQKKDASEEHEIRGQTQPGQLIIWVPTDNKWGKHHQGSNVILNFQYILVQYISVCTALERNRKKKIDR